MTPYHRYSFKKATLFIGLLKMRTIFTHLCWHTPSLKVDPKHRFFTIFFSRFHNPYHDLHVSVKTLYPFPCFCFVFLFLFCFFLFCFVLFCLQMTTCLTFSSSGPLGSIYSDHDNRSMCTMLQKEVDRGKLGNGEHLSFEAYKYKENNINVLIIM